MTMKSWKFVPILCSLLFASASTASAATITYNFTGGLGTQYNNSTPFTDTVGGVTATITAWTVTDNSGVESGDFSAATLGRYTQGLGVCNASEGGPNCASPDHQIDNIGGHDDFVLIYFGGATVNLSSITVDTVDDSDGDGRSLSYAVGNLGSNLTGDSASSFTFNSVNCASCSNPFTASLTGSGQYLLIGASLTNTSPDDEFKLSDLTVTTSSPVPEPTSMVLFGSGLLAAASKLRARRRKP